MSLRAVKRRRIHFEARKLYEPEIAALAAKRAKDPAGTRRGMLEHLTAIEQNVLKTTREEREAEGAI